MTEGIRRFRQTPATPLRAETKPELRARASSNPPAVTTADTASPATTPATLRAPTSRPNDSSGARARHNFDSGAGFRAFTLQNQVPARATLTSDVDEDYADEVVEYGLSFGATSLSSGLYGQSRDFRIGVVDRLVNSDNQNVGHALTNFGQNDRYATGDSAKLVADSFNDAWESGELTREELEHLAETMSAEEAADFAAVLAQDRQTTGDGDVLETWGEINEELAREADDEDEREARETAAAIAYSSSPALIEEHLDTTEKREQAFGRLERYLENREDRIGDWSDPYAFASGQQNFYGAVFANAVRLSEDEVGWSEQELEERLDGLGPEFTRDLIGRFDNSSGDLGVGGAVDRIGHAAGAIARRSDGDDRSEWQVTQDIAWTQSTRLIEENLQGQAAIDAFGRLEEHINSLGDDADEYTGDNGIRLPGYDAAVEGASRLFTHDESAILDHYLDDTNNVEDSATLVRFFENTLFSPNTRASDKRRIENHIAGYITPLLENPGANAVEDGMRAGQLLALTELAARRAFEAAGDNEEARSAISTFAARFFGKVAGAAAVAFTGNIFAGFAADAATTTILDLVFTPGSASSRREALEQQYLAELASSGGDSFFAPAFLDEVINPLNSASSRFLNERINELDAELANPNLTQEERLALETERNQLDSAVRQVNQLYDNIGNSYNTTINDRRIEAELESRE